MKSMKKIILSLIAIALVVSVACTVYASEGDIMSELEEMLQQENGKIDGNENTENIPEGKNNENTGLNTNTNLSSGNTNTNENLPETTPHAGIGDYSGLVFVAVFAVAAIYAYKKVKEYNA